MALLSKNLGDLLLKEAEHVAKEVVDISITGRKSPELQRKLSRKINGLLQEHRYTKIGKTANADVRFRKEDYKSYHTMYLVYATSSKNYIAHYESLFIKKFMDRLDNQHHHSTGRVPDVKPICYYLYVVVED